MKRYLLGLVLVAGCCPTPEPQITTERPEFTQPKPTVEEKIQEPQVSKEKVAKEIKALTFLLTELEKQEEKLQSDVDMGEKLRAVLPEDEEIRLQAGHSLLRYIAGVKKDINRRLKELEKKL